MTIYIVRSDCGRMKVGFTESETPDERVRGLQTGSPRKLTCILSFPGSVTDERRLHGALKSDHVHGEWFKPGAAIASLMSHVKRFGTSDGWTLAEQLPELWAEFVAEHGHGVGLGKLREALRGDRKWELALGEQAALKRLKPADIEDCWIVAGGPCSHDLNFRHVIAEPWESRAVEVRWIHRGEELTGSGVARTAELLFNMNRRDSAWVWLAACLHEVTRTEDTKRLFLSNVREAKAIRGFVRSACPAAWHQLSPALPRALTIPYRCYLTAQEFVKMCADHCQLSLIESAAVIRWPEGAYVERGRRRNVEAA